MRRKLRRAGVCGQAPRLRARPVRAPSEGEAATAVLGVETTAHRARWHSGCLLSESSAPTGRESAEEPSSLGNSMCSTKVKRLRLSRVRPPRGYGTRRPQFPGALTALRSLLTKLQVISCILCGWSCPKPHFPIRDTGGIPVSTNANHPVCIHSLYKSRRLPARIRYWKALRRAAVSGL